MADDVISEISIWTIHIRAMLFITGLMINFVDYKLLIARAWFQLSRLRVTTRALVRARDVVHTDEISRRLQLICACDDPWHTSRVTKCDFVATRRSPSADSSYLANVLFIVM